MQTTAKSNQTDFCVQRDAVFSRSGSCALYFQLPTLGISPKQMCTCSLRANVVIGSNKDCCPPPGGRGGAHVPAEVWPDQPPELHHCPHVFTTHNAIVSNWYLYIMSKDNYLQCSFRVWHLSFLNINVFACFISKITRSGLKMLIYAV